MWACRVCGSQSISRSTQRSDAITVSFCASCDMGIADAVAENTSVFYDDGYYLGTGSDEGVGYDDYSDVAEHSVSWAAALADALPGEGPALDVGCADGLLLSKLRQPRQLFGIETVVSAAETAADRGVRILSNDILDEARLAPLRGQIQILTAIAVLEHIADIRSATEACLDLLTVDGVMLFEVPLLTGTPEDVIWLTTSLEHVWYPTQSALTHLFSKELGAQLHGHPLHISGYGWTYAGLAYRGEVHRPEIERLWNELTGSPLTEISSPEVRRAKIHLDFVHRAVPDAALVRALTELPPSDLTPQLVRRVARVTAETIGALTTANIAIDGAREWERLRADRIEETLNKTTADYNELHSLWSSVTGTDSAQS